MPNSRFGHSFAVVKELPPTRFYSDGRPVDKDKEDTATVSQQVGSLSIDAQTASY